MLVAAKLVRNNKVVSDGLLFKETGERYRVSVDHHSFVGETLAIVDGPLTYFDDDVYLVELLNPPRTNTTRLPIFNSMSGYTHEYVTISLH
jgi:hypothetical protein